MLLSAHNVSKHYGDHIAVDGVDFGVEDGEIVALLGPNGSGKTTLMSMLVGLMQPTSGSIAQRTDRVGWVPQTASVYQRLTVLENLRVLSRLVLGHTPDASDIGKALDASGLGRWASHRADELSGGLRQRLNLAIGLVSDPRVVVLDEPTTGVDLDHASAIWTSLLERREAGAGIVFATHYLREARVADRLVMLVDGHIAYEGTLEGLRDFADADEAHANVDDPLERGMLAVWGQEAADSDTRRHG